PISRTQVYVLDNAFRPVPVGIAGELYVGGDGLARGYLNAPDLTAEKFLPHPFGSSLGARLYATGDLVRYRSDGTLEFLGRKDNQVKIRGFRVEPGEVEHALRDDPAVRSGAVVVGNDKAGDRRLVGYVVLRPGANSSESGIRERLRERLPEYSVPSRVVILETMPLTANGKLDRNALPAPGVEKPEKVKAGAAPANPIEEQLVAVWKSVLGVEQIGVRESFFEAGGHSLLALRLISRVREQFQIDIAPAVIYAPTFTIESLAKLIIRSCID